jgi:hypothetical protein
LFCISPACQQTGYSNFGFPNIIKFKFYLIIEYFFASLRYIFLPYLKIKTELALKSVISASRRTDIPAYYLDWFIKGLRSGRLEVQNPLYRHKFTNVDLTPENTGWIVFWSRNYERFLKNRSSFCEYRLFFHFTIVSHHPELEKRFLPVAQALDQMQKLVALYDAKNVTWRYDPIVIWVESNQVRSNYQEKEFAYLAKEIRQAGIRRCYFSFSTPYRKFISKARKKYPDWILQHPGIEQKKSEILKKIISVSRQFDIQLYSCCNDNLIGEYVKKGSCISGNLLNALSGERIVSEAKAPSRPDCGCSKSIDIGSYEQQPCYMGCMYCYANPVI